MKDLLEKKVAEAVSELFGVDVKLELTRPEEQFGDYATNVALQLAKQVGKNPREVGEELAAKLREALTGQVSEVLVAGPGFINLKLSDSSLVAALNDEPSQSLAGQEILVEFGDPNPFKEMHIGHLYSYVAGDAISSLLEAAGAKVQRLSYHGDVGLHVAKAIWGMQQQKVDPNDTKLSDKLRNMIGLFYSEGAKAYEEEPGAKEQIDAINQQVYAQDPAIAKLYDWGRQLSFDYFDVTLEDLGVKTDRRYLESAAAPIGTELVKQNVGKVFAESQGAIVYEGEKAGLHTRVFLTSKGLPTYEAKDLGLTELKNRDYPQASQSIIITANEQAEYFKVMLAALKDLNPELAAKTKHLSHGFVSLSTGKMSSRTGDVFLAVSLLADVVNAVKQAYGHEDHAVQLGAIKYEFIRHRLGGDIVYDVEESVSLEGNSGPYLQYAHARARSILGKTEAQGSLEGADLEPGERSLARKMGEYNEVVDKAVADLMPHHISTYLYELAQVFNRFYEKNRVLDDPRQSVRLALVSKYAATLKAGLSLLGIASPDKM